MPAFSAAASRNDESCEARFIAKGVLTKDDLLAPVGELAVSVYADAGEKEWLGTFGNVDSFAWLYRVPREGAAEPKLEINLGELDQSAQA